MLRIRGPGHVDRPVRQVVLAGHGDPTQVSAVCRTAQEPRDLVCTVQHLRRVTSYRRRADIRAAARRERGQGRGFLRTPLLRSASRERGEAAPAGHQQVSSGGRMPGGRNAESVLMSSNNCVGQILCRIERPGRVSQLPHQASLTALGEIDRRVEIHPGGRGRQLIRDRRLQITNPHQPPQTPPKNGSQLMKRIANLRPHCTIPPRNQRPGRRALDTPETPIGGMINNTDQWKPHPSPQGTSSISQQHEHSA